MHHEVLSKIGGTLFLVVSEAGASSTSATPSPLCCFAPAGRGGVSMYFWMIFHATTAVTFLSTEVVANVLRGVVAIVTVAKFTRVVVPLMEAYPQIGEEDLLTKAPGL